MANIDVEAALSSGKYTIESLRQIAAERGLGLKYASGRIEQPEALQGAKSESGSTSLKEAVFPYKDPQMQIAGKPVSLIGAPHAADLLSIASLPGRLAASVPTLAPGGENYLQALARTGSKPDAGALASLPDIILRDPALLPSLAMGSEALNLVKGVGVASKAARAISKGAAEGLTSAGIHRAESIAKGEEPSAKAGLAEILLSAGMPGAGSLAKPFNKHVYSKLASEATGVKEKTLMTASTKTGRQALKDAAGKQQEIGEKILVDLENIDSIMPERNEINKALQSMPAVKTSVLDVLEKAKVKNPVGAAKKANDQITSLQNDILKEISATGNDYVANAATLRGIRMQLDKEIGDQFGKSSSHYISALKQARYGIANDLIEGAKASGNPQYVKLMTDYSAKIKKVDKLLGYLGITPESRERRIESFTANLFNKNKRGAQGALGDVGDIMGKDYLKQIELSDMASELSPEGVATWLPTQSTGRMVAGVAAPYVGSPKLVTRIAIPALEREQATPTASSLMQLLRSGAFRPEGEK